MSGEDLLGRLSGFVLNRLECKLWNSQSLKPLRGQVAYVRVDSSS